MKRYWKRKRIERRADHNEQLSHTQAKRKLDSLERNAWGVQTAAGNVEKAQQHDGETQIASHRVPRRKSYHFDLIKEERPSRHPRLEGEANCISEAGGTEKGGQG